MGALGFFVLRPNGDNEIVGSNTATTKKRSVADVG